MLPPMRPRPTIPSFMRIHLLESDAHDGPSALFEGSVVARRLGLDEPAEAEVPSGIGSSSPGSSTTWMKRPVGGPPLCSCPVECR